MMMKRFLTNHFVPLLIFLPAFAPAAIVSADPCEHFCLDYEDTDVYDPCLNWCNNSPDFFDPEYPYVFGPLELKSYPQLTGINGPEIHGLVGALWARVDKTRRKIQFRYRMDSNPAPFFPYFAMHLHQGNLVAEEIGGHILVSIAGAGDLSGCFGLSFNGFAFVPCSDLCTEGNERLGNCITPGMFGQRCIFCDAVVKAYFCQGGCQGDGRISGYDTEGFLASCLAPTETVAPSRSCDLSTNNPSNPVQDKWIQGLYSNEFSGNPEDGVEYSPYSIGVSENWDLFCGDDITFLVDEVLKEGAASYVALHVNFNSTGLPALLYGDIFTQLTSTEGGPQKCYIFGDTDHTCVDGLGDVPSIQTPST